MTLRLLKSLRITARRNQAKTILSRLGPSVPIAEHLNERKLANPVDWKSATWFSISIITATVFAPISPVAAQQFRAPRPAVPSPAETMPTAFPTPAASGYTQTSGNEQRSAAQRYIPPVHITPNNTTSVRPRPAEFQASTPSQHQGQRPLRRRGLQLVEAPNPSAGEAPGLQDRITQAFTRKKPEDDFVETQPRQLSQNANYANANFARGVTNQAVNQTVNQGAGGNAAQPSQISRVGGFQRSLNVTDTRNDASQIQHTAMQEPIHDPFADQVDQRNVDQGHANQRYAVQTQIAPRPLPPNRDRATTQQISVLNRSYPQENSNADASVPADVRAEETFGTAGDLTSIQEFQPIPEPKLDLVNPPTAPVQQDSAEELPSPRRQTTPRQNPQQRLEALMEETENDLRNSERSRRAGDQDNFELDRPADRPHSLLNLDEGTGDGYDQPKKQTLLDKSCEDFRNQLLDNPIHDIALDMSPPMSKQRNESTAVARSWSDRWGNVIATGTLVDLRRGYIVLDSGQQIAFARLSDADLAVVSEYWQVPTYCSAGDRGSLIRNWVPQTYTWTASSLCHKPLYFENIQLERYGHSHGPFTQPVRSVGHFFVSLATLPYQTAISPANECEYSLGLFRPGDCAPWLKDPIPISLNGMRRQALVTTGLALIP